MTSNNGFDAIKSGWSTEQWMNKLFEMIQDLTFFYPLPIGCSQVILVESFGNFKKDYCYLLYSLNTEHYQQLDLLQLI